MGQCVSQSTGRKRKLKKCVVEDLLRNTQFTEFEIKEWYNTFMEVAPCGKITYEQYQQLVLRIVFRKGPEHVEDLGTKIMHHLDLSFRQYDIDGDNTINFREFLIGMSISTKGSLEEKIKWAFSLYDIDKDGIITLKEMQEILMIADKAYGDNRRKEELQTFVNHIFTYLDADHNGVISVQEFILGLKARPELFDFFTNASDCLSTLKKEDFKAASHAHHNGRHGVLLGS